MCEHPRAENEISMSSPRMLPMAGFILLGLLPATAGTWLWVRHDAQKQAAAAAREARATRALARISAGDLPETLRRQAALRGGELKTATAWLAAREEAADNERAGETRLLAEETEAATTLENELRTLAARQSGDASAGSQPQLKEEARKAAGLETLEWQALKRQWEELATKLSRPIQAGERAALSAQIGELESKAPAGSLPDPETWEKSKRTLLDEWRNKTLTAP